MTDQQLIEAARQAGLCFPDCWNLERTADDIAAENRWVEDGRVEGLTISQTRRQILEVGRQQRDERLQQLHRFADLIRGHHPEHRHPVNPEALEAFRPRNGAASYDEEVGYRRGFDQGVAAFAYALGIDNDGLQALAWKQRIGDFRHGRTAEVPNAPSKDERLELLALTLETLADALPQLTTRHDYSLSRRASGAGCFQLGALLP